MERSLKRPVSHEDLIRGLAAGLTPVRRLPQPPVRALAWLAAVAGLACGLAAFADLPPRERVERVVDVWTHLDVTELVRLDVKGILAMGARLLGRAPPAPRPAHAGRDGLAGRPRPGAITASDAPVPVREGGLIDPDGLERLVSRSIPFERIDANLHAGHLDALTVSTTHVRSGRTVVHVHRREAELPRWSHDPTTFARATRITERHALASAAIPILFRAVALDGDWHCDGGLRQNVPLSPARRLGAARVLVVNPRYIASGPLDDRAADDLFPGPLFLLGKTLNALLLDRIDTDLARLETINRILAAGTKVAGDGFVASLNRAMGFSEGQGLRPMTALLVRASADIGEMAAEYVRRPSFARIGGMTGRLMRALSEPDSRNEADLLSYVLFDGGFCSELIALGRADARAKHEDLCAFFADAGTSVEHRP
jgi:NTE family protein